MERDSTQEQYEEMTQTPVPKLVLRLAVPTTISMLVTSIYNMADTLFVSQLGTSVSGATGSWQSTSTSSGSSSSASVCGMKP